MCVCFHTTAEVKENLFIWDNYTLICFRHHEGIMSSLSRNASVMIFLLNKPD